MLDQFTDREMVISCTTLIGILSKSDLVNGAELCICQRGRIARKNFNNEVRVSWDVERSKSHIVSLLHYYDEDGVRVDLNISVNAQSKVIEIEFWKYADNKIMKFPTVEDLEVQDISI